MTDNCDKMLIMDKTDKNNKYLSLIRVITDKIRYIPHKRTTINLISQKFFVVCILSFLCFVNCFFF